jgi:hypothetical protein
LQAEQLQKNFVDQPINNRKTQFETYQQTLAKYVLIPAK